MLQAWCKVRLLLDDRGRRLEELLPSQAAKVVGWREDIPSAGQPNLCTSVCSAGGRTYPQQVSLTSLPLFSRLEGGHTLSRSA